MRVVSQTRSFVSHDPETSIPLPTSARAVTGPAWSVKTARETSLTGSQRRSDCAAAAGEYGRHQRGDRERRRKALRRA